MKEQSSTKQSNNTHSLLLSDVSSLSSDSERPDMGSNSDQNDEDEGSMVGGRRFSDTKHQIANQQLQRRRRSSQDNSKSKKTKAKTSKAKKGVQPRQPKPEEYCICRRGYDGEEFMIACDGCQEWFHGRCVGVKPKSVSKHYYCDSCRVPSPLPPQQPIPPPSLPVVNETTSKSKGKGRNKKGGVKSKQTQLPKTKAKSKKEEPKAALPPMATITLNHNDEDEDLDDICPVCDSECTCGAAKSELDVTVEEESANVFTSKKPADVWTVTDDAKMVVERDGHEQEEPKPKRKPKKSKKPQAPAQTQADEQTKEKDTEIELIVDDEAQKENLFLSTADDELDSIYAESRTESYGSSVHIDSGDDSDLEKEEERAIIEDVENRSHTDDSDDEESDDLEDESDEEIWYDDEEEEEAEEGIRMLNDRSHWSSSENEEEEEEEEYDMYFMHHQRQHEPDSEPDQDVLTGANAAHLFDSIASAFLQILTPLGQGEPSDMERRPSLPSSAVSAAHHHASTDNLTSEALGALSALAAENAMSLPLTTENDHHPHPQAADHSNHVRAATTGHISSAELKFQEQLLDLIGMTSMEDDSATSKADLSALIPPTTPLPGSSPNTLSSARHALSMPSSPILSSSPCTTDFGSDRKRSLDEQIMSGKKRRLSAENALASTQSSPIESEPTPVSMDELVDTSQLYTRSSSRSPSPDPDELDTRLSRDLSRWQRVPIGAFRLMRSKNKHWFER
ncbi:hypothetical protein BCR43DRAFT_483281 [Syncephalastrum racemosum]|uniref:PHD-type domain-containing protein n=1 Tax=Syncephalastrum racemosum TaxID=13706 RepID=A0A1X2HV19_SYNRA|nr:hypothetical protein BCR43DRAFT_483281 [Syncephalastrum racemosum]